MDRLLPDPEPAKSATGPSKSASMAIMKTRGRKDRPTLPGDVTASP